MGTATGGCATLSMQTMDTAEGGCATPGMGSAQDWLDGDGPGVGTSRPMYDRIGRRNRPHRAAQNVTGALPFLADSSAANPTRVLHLATARPVSGARPVRMLSTNATCSK